MTTTTATTTAATTIRVLPTPTQAHVGNQGKHENLHKRCSNSPDKLEKAAAGCKLQQ